MKKPCCINCGKILDTPLRNPNRTYCNFPACQKVRKRIWQEQKMASDPDYKANQRNAQKVWRDANPDYHKKYRKKNDAYTQKNRTRQAERNKNRRVPSETPDRSRTFFFKRRSQKPDQDTDRRCNKMDYPASRKDRS